VSTFLGEAHRTATPKAIADLVAGNVDQLCSVLRDHRSRCVPDLEDYERAGIVTFALAGTGDEELSAALRAHELTATVSGGLVRLSPHATTSDAAPQRLAETLTALNRRSA